MACSAAASPALAGSSDYFVGGVVSYADSVKQQVLGVAGELLDEHGAVSEEVAAAMAQGVRRLTGATYGLSTTGIAGPGGGTPAKPVGLVCLACADAEGVVAEQQRFPGDRRDRPALGGDGRAAPSQAPAGELLVTPRGRARGAGRPGPRRTIPEPPPTPKAASATTEPHQRLFVALDLPDDALAAVRAWQELVFADLPDLRINHALHLTLCFLGDTPSRVVPQLSEALAGVPFRRCSLAFGEPIFLPERGKKNVVALPLVDAAHEPGGLAAVRELQAGVGAALAAERLLPARAPRRICRT